MGFFDFIRKKLGRAAASNTSANLAPPVRYTSMPSPQSPPSEALSTEIVHNSVSAETAETVAPPLKEQPKPAELPKHAPPRKPRKPTKKQIAALHSTDPGWDRPDEREEILVLVREKAELLLETYKGTVGKAREEDPSYKNYDMQRAASKQWGKSLNSFIVRTLKRRLGPDLVGFDSLVVYTIVDTAIVRMYESEKAKERAEKELRERDEALQQMIIARKGLVYSDNMSPIEYESFCAKMLQHAGWTAEVTQASGDQGVDVIAKRWALVGVFQCKKYSKPVGNAAVQEIISGKVFYNADFAAVVSTASFTPSAVALAARANVLLLHHNDLRTFTPPKKQL